MAIEGQSPEIAQSVTSEAIEETGAGDQVKKSNNIKYINLLGNHVWLCH